MKNTSELSLGDWYCACCLHDLQHIATLDDLEEARDAQPFRGGWATCAEAVSALIAECDPDERDSLIDWYSGAVPEIAAEIRLHV